MKRYVISLAAAMLAATGTAGAAFADPPQQTTYTFTDTFTGPVTCPGGPDYKETRIVTITDYLAYSGQTTHDRSTISISFTGTPNEPGLPTVTGTSKSIATGNSAQTGAFDNTFNTFTTAAYSDGTTVTAHQISHVTIGPDGLPPIVSVDRCL